MTTGTPIGLLIMNADQKSKDYSKIKDVFRPAHADTRISKSMGCVTIEVAVDLLQERQRCA